MIAQLTATKTDGHKIFLTTAWSIKESLYKWYGDGEVDFIEHLHIEKIIVNDNSGVAHCKLIKGQPIELTVHFLFFNDNCISWVVSQSY